MPLTERIWLRLYGLLHHVLQTEVELYRKKLFGGFLHKMENFIKPFLEKSVRLSLLKTPVYVDNTESSIIKYLQKIIFKHDVLVEFKEVLNLVFSPEPFNVTNDVISKAIKGLNTVLLSDEDVKIKADVFRYVFQSFASSCKEVDSLSVVQFFIVLSHILGMNKVPNANESNDCLINVENFKNGFKVDAPSLSSESFLIFKELLLCLSKTSINLNALEVQSYSKWLQHLIKNLANFKPFQNVYMEIFYISAELDVKLLEGNLDDIFQNIFAQGQSINENFPESYADFLEKSFKICAQFQRTVKFVSKFLSSIKITSTVLTKEIILPLNFVTEFSKIVTVASNQQSLSLLDVLMQNLEECFKHISQEESEYESHLLFIVSELLINFFQNMKLYAPSIASTTLQAIIERMNSVKTALQKFGDFLFSSKSFIQKNKNIVKTFLELCFYCGEIQMLIDCYKDSVLHPSDIKNPETDYDWQYCISMEQWKNLVNFVLKSKLENCDSQCFQLGLQKLRACKLQNKSLTENSTLKIIIHQLTLDLDKFNIFQQLPPEDLTILMNSLTVKQSKAVTRNIFNQLQQNDDETESATWLSNSAIQESAVFIAILFSEILKTTGSLLQDMIKDKHSSMMTWLDGLNDYDAIPDEILESLPENINSILKSGKKLRKSITNHDALTRIVDVFKLLPLFCMKESFRRLGLSFAVAMGVLLANDENAVCSAFESICKYLSSNLDASECFDIGLLVKFLSECCYQNERTDCIRVKIIESLVRNSVNMKFGLSQLGEMIDSADSFKHSSLMKVLETQILLYNELGKCWQRAKKRKSDNDQIGNCRTKLAKIITEESKQLSDAEIKSENCEMLFKIISIEINKAIRLNDENEIKNLMELKFPAYFEFAVKNLKNGFDEQSVMFLTIILQSISQLRKFIPEKSVFKIWKALKNQEKVNWRLFCVNTTEEEFNEVLDDLLKVSQKFLYSNSDKHSSNCFEIWVSFFEFTKDSKRNSCQLHLQEFFNYIHDCDLFLRELSINKKIFLLKFFSFCVKNKEVVVTSHVIDTIIRVILECFDDSPSIEDFRSLFTVEVDVASAILFRQFAWSKSKIHLIFVIFKHLLNSLMKRCDGGQEIEKDDVFKLSNCAFCLEKWVSLMVKKEKDFARISAYFITALISSIASVTVLPAIKIHLTNCINHFLSMSDSHTVAYLMRILKPGYQQLFNSLYVQFKKYHKYTGKI